MTRFAFALPLVAAFALPQLAAAERYECTTALGTACRTAIQDGWSAPDGAARAGSATSTLLVLPGACPQADRVVDVDLSVRVLHPYVGDLEIVLSHPDGTAVPVLYRPGIGIIDGNCPNDDLEVSFDDDDGVSAVDMCRATIPALGGSVLPFNPLSLFDGKARNGSWTLTLRDHRAGAEGALLGWTLELPCKPDLPDVTLDTTDALVSERGPDDRAIVTFSRGGEPGGALEVAYMVTGSASLADFEPLPGKLEIPGGESSAALEIRAVEDDLDERDESIIITLLPGPDYEVGARQSAFITLIEHSDAVIAGGDGGAIDGGAPASPGEGHTARDDTRGASGSGTQRDRDETMDGDDSCACRLAGGSTGEPPVVPFAVVALVVTLRARRRTR